MIDLKFIKSCIKKLESAIGAELLTDNYLLIDVETTGVDVGFDNVTQLGYLPVIDGKIAHDPISATLQLPKGKSLSPEVVSKTNITQEMCDSGLDRFKAFKEFAHVCQTYINKRYPIIGHNMMLFDIPIIENECFRLDIDFKVATPIVLDTGALIKGAQLCMAPNVDESPRNYSKRILDLRRKGVFWSLDFCINALKLDRKYGIEKEKAHDAGYDCKITQLVIEEICNA